MHVCMSLPTQPTNINSHTSYNSILICVLVCANVLLSVQLAQVNRWLLVRHSTFISLMHGLKLPACVEHHIRTLQGILCSC